MSNLSDAMDGLATQLQAQITNLRAYDHPPDSISSFPAAWVLPTIDYEYVIGDNTMEVMVSVWFMVSSGDDKYGFRELWHHMDPTEANKSVKAAINADSTLGSKVDYAILEIARNVGRSEEWGGWYIGAEFLVRMVKTIG